MNDGTVACLQFVMYKWKRGGWSGDEWRLAEVDVLKKKKREQSRTLVGSWEERKGGIIRENAGNQQGRKIGLADMFKRVPRRRIREKWNERGWEIMRRRKRERGEWKDRDDFLFRQTHCGSFIISPRQLLRPPALSFSSLFPSLSVFLSVFHSISVCHSLSIASSAPCDLRCSANSLPRLGLCLRLLAPAMSFFH